MSILAKLASALNRRDEAPNVALAAAIADTQDKKAIQELAGNLTHNNKNIQSDCIKVMYEIAALDPALIVPFAPQLVALLDSKNNRLQWGAMTALDAITGEIPGLIYASLPEIIAVADKGSVITNDHCISILIKLCAIKKYEAAAFSLLNECLLKSPANQLPMYAENTVPVITPATKSLFVKTLTSRLGDIEKESKRKRFEKVLKKLKD